MPFSKRSITSARLVVNNYSIYEADIKPKGFQVIEFDGFISQKTLDETRYLLAHPEKSQRDVRA